MTSSQNRSSAARTALPHEPFIFHLPAVMLGLALLAVLLVSANGQGDSASWATPPAPLTSLPPAA